MRQLKNFMKAKKPMWNCGECKCITLQCWRDNDEFCNCGTSSEGLGVEYKFKNWNGRILKQGSIEEGATPTPPADPTKPATAEYTYTFAGWDPEVGPISEDTIYTAQFEATPRNYTVTIGVSPEGTGTVNSQQVTVAYGTEISSSDNVLTIGSNTITATASEGYEFSSWGTLPATVTGDLTITATFEAAGYTLTFLVSDESYSEGGGTISAQSIVVPFGTTVETNDPMHERHGSSLIFKNNGQTIATVNAIPNSGYIFEYWSTGGSYYDEGYELCEDLEFIGAFRSSITVTFVVNPVGGGTVSQQSIVVPSDSYASVNYGNDDHLIIDLNCYQYNEVIATANQGYDFVSWDASGTIIDSEHSLYLGAQDITITVNFEQLYTITFQPYMEEYGSGVYIGDGGGTCSPSSVTVTAGAYASRPGYGVNTITVIDPVLGNTTVTFTKEQDTDQYSYYDESGWGNYYDGSDYDYTYDNLIDHLGIDNNGTVGFNVDRYLKSYDVYINEAYSSGSGSESYSQDWDYQKPYGTTWTVNGNTITFSDGSSVTATPDSGSYLGGWYLGRGQCYEDRDPLPASGTITGEIRIYVRYGKTYTITFQPYMVDYDTGTTIGDGGGTCAPSSVTVTESARATVNGTTMTIIDPVLGNTNVVFSIAQDTAQYNYSFDDFGDYQGDSTYYYLMEGDGIGNDGTVGVEVIRETIKYECYLHSADISMGEVICSNPDFYGYVPYGTTWTVNGNVITLSDGTTFTATPESGYTFNGWYDTNLNTMPASGTITGDIDYRAIFDSPL